MMGKLFVIGVGPGDPGLITVKAVKILKDVPCIIVPKGREEGSSLALSIVKKAVSIDGKEIVEAYFPMKRTASAAEPAPGKHGLDKELDASWSATADDVIKRLERGTDAAFITLGDPTLYSTFFYLYDKLIDKRPDIDIVIVPGVSSITAAAARAGIRLGLGNERIAILPANYLEAMEEALHRFDTVVLMKVNKVFDTVRGLLTDMNLAQHGVYIARAGMEDEIMRKDIRTVKDEDLNYFSLVIVRKS